MSLSQQKVLIIGGTSGFGQQIAQQALESQANVYIIGRNEKRLQTALSGFKKYDDRIHGSALDAHDAHQLEQFLSSFGPFDHVVSMLGGAMGGGFMDSPLSLIRQTIEDKFFANLQLVKIIVPYLNKNGSFTMTSGAGGKPHNASGAIVGNRAINTLVEGLAVELAPDYRVNAVAPTWTPTGLWRGNSPQDLQQQEMAMSQSIPLKRVATKNEVASAYIYLMNAAFVTGQILHVDGGIDLAD